MGKIEWNVGNKRVKRPDFLIVGTARSGTTSLYHYIRPHPGIYIETKEPKFITSQFLKFPLRGPGDQKLVDGTYVRNFEDYKKLFLGIKKEKAIGEASVDTLYYYKKSIPLIKKYLGDPKILIILRNPVDRAFSAYTALCLDNEREERLSFEDALKQEKNRIKNNWEMIWHYRKMGFYSEQVKAFIDNFSRVKVCLFDDLKKNPEQLIKEIYEFLGVDPSFKPSLKSKYAVSGLPKSKALQKFLDLIGPIENGLIKPVARSLGLKEKLAPLRARIKVYNLSKPKMKKETRNYLKTLYRKDIIKLGKLIDRDLSPWLK